MGTYDTRGGHPLHDPAADHFPLCRICRRDAADCICPECPRCGGVGDPRCYEAERRDARPPRPWYIETWRVVPTEDELRAAVRGKNHSTRPRAGMAFFVVALVILVGLAAWLLLASLA